MSARDYEAINQEILAETRKLADAYRLKFADDPDAELRAWLQIAARREAMVSDVYGEAERSYRLPEPHCPAAEVAWEALTLIWQQEVVHTKFIEVKLRDGVLSARGLSADAMLWLGAMEGKFLGALTSRPGVRSVFARLAAHLGALFVPDKVPPFTLAFGEMNPRDFFLLCAALETTARQSYARMEELSESLADRAIGDSRHGLQLENLSRELRLKLLDETFHEQAFQEMAGWTNDGQLDRSLDGRVCAQRLSKLLPRSAKSVGDPDSPVVATDGGLGKLFEKWGIPVLVAAGW